MKNVKSKIFNGIIFLVGLILCSYPLVSSVVERQSQRGAVATYQKAVKEKDSSEIEKALADAEKYNDMLYQSNGALVDGMDQGILSKENYNELLNTSGTGVMGSLEIPKIDVDLPIYHGTEEDVLSNGVGHWFGSSLPIGGTNTRSILTGHRGLPTSKLFTRLDEVEEGDLFFINVCDNILAYKVYDIQILTPEEAELLSPEAEKDLVTLITCTPYGINTHRLCVTGERVAYEKASYTSIKREMPSWRELIFTVLPFFFVGIVLISFIKNLIKNRRAKKHAKKESETLTASVPDDNSDDDDGDSC